MIEEPTAHVTGPGAGGRPTRTGRLLVAFAPSAETGRIAGTLRNEVGVQAAEAFEMRSELGSAMKGLERAGAPDAVVFERLGVALISADPEQESRLLGLVRDPGSTMIAIEPERFVYPTSSDYVAGFRDGVDALASHLQPGEHQPPPDDDGPPWDEDDEATWGMRAVGALDALVTGTGVRVGILDTGIDADHPLLAPGIDQVVSFIEGEPPHDGHGHGTHVAGTIGARGGATRLGVAPGCRIFAAKVLSNAGSGTDGQVLDGIEWALENDCNIISMSLGSTWEGPGRFSEVYETVAGRALDQGCVIIAASGNDSSRSSGVIAPVGTPANAPSVVAVAATDVANAIADFSNGTVLPGGQIDVCGPGVDVLSTWPGDSTRRLSGTSMATPHASGVAALLAERDQPATARELLGRLLQVARRLPLPATDIGAGLVSGRDVSAGETTTVAGAGTVRPADDRR